MSSLIIICAAAIFLSVGSSQLFLLSKGRKLPRHRSLAALAFASLLAIPVVILQVYDGYALRLDLNQIVPLAGLATMCALLILSIRMPIQSLAALLSPFTGLSLLPILLGPNDLNPIVDISGGMVIHIIISIMAYAVFTLAALQALLLWGQNHQLRHHQLNGFIVALPSLQTMESLLFRLVTVGQILLTISIATGFAFVDDIFAQQIAHKTIFTILSWFIFMALLIGRRVKGWRGMTAIKFTTAGFLMMVLAFIGSKFMVELILS